MQDIKNEILKELDKLEEVAAVVLDAKQNAHRQTNLETAILNRQVQSLRAANTRAQAYIGETMSILKKLKKAPRAAKAKE